MLNLLVVEDEPIECNALLNILREHLKDVNLFISASNGIEAISQYEIYVPDIILMDINIPGKNGLEVMHDIKDLHLGNPIFIILTSYNYFEYAQEAIKLGVDEFLLKPIRTSTLVEVMDNCLNKLKNNEVKMQTITTMKNKINNFLPQVEKQCLYSIITNTGLLDIAKNISLLDYEVTSGFCIIIEQNKVNAIELQNFLKRISALGLKYIKGQFHQRFIVLITSGTNLIKEDILTLQTFFKESKICLTEIGIGHIKNDSKDFRISYEEALRNFEKDYIYLFEDEKILLPFEKNSLKETAKIILLDYLFFKEDEAIKELDKVLILIQPYNTIEKIDILTALFDEYINLMVDEWGIQGEFLKSSLGAEMKEIKVDRSSIISLFFKLMKPFEHKRKPNVCILVHQIVQYINDNYRHAISLNDVADKLGISSYYVCKLLSMSEHKTFIDLLNAKRVDEAKKLLMKNERIKDITFEVGFQSPTYFARVFKKNEGITPKEYKAKFIIEQYYTQML